MSLIILAMVNTKRKAGSGTEIKESCVIEDHLTMNATSSLQQDKDTSGKLDWDESMIWLVLSCFSWGYLTTQIIGGRLAEMFGFKTTYGLGLFIPALLMLLHPVAARTDAKLFITLRVLVGVFEGVTWPSMHALTSQWVPAEERSSWVSQTYFGSTFGMVFTLPVCGLIITSYGWEACFYIISSITLLWSLVWYLLVHDKPEDHPRISAEELEEISSIQVSSTRPPVPWLDIVKSAPMWGTLITDCGNTFGIIVLARMGPTYMKFMLGLDIKTSGFLSGLPMLSRYVGGVLISRLSDWLIKTGRITRLSARRLFNTTSQVVPAVFMLLMVYSGCNTTVAVCFMVIAMGLNAIAAGHFVSAVDLAPNFAGTLLGVTNTFSGGGMGSITPLVVGAIINNNHTWAAWQAVFWVTAGVYVVGNCVYVATIQAEPQYWNEVKNKEDNGKDEC